MSLSVATHNYKYFILKLTVFNSFCSPGCLLNGTEVQVHINQAYFLKWRKKKSVFLDFSELICTHDPL